MASRSHSAVLAVALLISVVAHVIVAAGFAAGWLLIVNIGLIGFLVRDALRRHREIDSTFDAVVGSEVIVAFGVLSLILGLVVGLSSVFRAAGSAAAIDVGTMAVAAGQPFLIGLLTAGVAPMLAMVVRLRCAEDLVAVDLAGETAALAGATEALTKRLRAAEAIVGKLAVAMTETMVSSQKLATALEVDGGRLRTSLLESGGGLKQFGVAAGETGTAVQLLGGATGRLTASSAEATTLLDELGRLIAAVERFVAPAR